MGGEPSFLTRFASRFSLSDFPAFLPEGFCGDLSGMGLLVGGLGRGVEPARGDSGGL